MTNAYEDAGKGIGRAVVGDEVEGAFDDPLPAPTSVTIPVPNWVVRNEGATSGQMPLTVRRESGWQGEAVLMIEQGSQKIVVHPAAISELYAVLRAAKLWKAS